MKEPTSGPGWMATGRTWIRESVLKPAYRWLATIDHPRQVGQGIDYLEKAYRRLDPRPPKVEAEAPFVLVVAWGTSADGLGRLARELDEARHAHPGWEPLIVTDCADLNAVGTRGLKIEHVPPYDAWCADNDPQDWPEFLSGRLAHLRQVYSATGALVVSGECEPSAVRQGVLQVFGPLVKFDDVA